jgi:hypothetical protein
MASLPHILLVMLGAGYWADVELQSWNGFDGHAPWALKRLSSRCGDPHIRPLAWAGVDCPFKPHAEAVPDLQTVTSDG